MAELQESEEIFELRRLEYQRETWEVERGLQVNKYLAKVACSVGLGSEVIHSSIHKYISILVP